LSGSVLNREDFVQSIQEMMDLLDGKRVLDETDVEGMKSGKPLALQTDPVPVMVAPLEHGESGLICSRHSEDAPEDASSVYVPDPLESDSSIDESHVSSKRGRAPPPFSPVDIPLPPPN
jgi:hypothetical protein